MSDEKKKNNLITYIGQDTVFLKNLQTHFTQKHPSLALSYNDYFSTNEKEIQGYINRFKEEQPNVILLDLSKSGDKFLHIARVWERLNFYKKIHIIGLLDYAQTREDLTRALSASLRCVHIKSPTVEAVSFSILALGFPDKYEDHGFATAQMTDEVNAYFLSKPVRVSENKISMESDISLIPGQEFRMKNFWSQKKIIKSEFCRLEEQNSDDNYYNFNFVQNVSLLHMDPLVNEEEETPDEIKAKEEKREQLIKESKFNMAKWIKENFHLSSPKYFKALIIDKKGVFYDENEPTDSYTFVFRAQPFLKTPEKEIRKYKPHMIIFHLESIKDEELEANSDIAHTFNETRTLQAIIKAIQRIYTDKEPPFIVVFNAPDFETEYLQKTLKYEKIVSYGEELNVELAIKLIKILNLKLEPTFPKTNRSEIIINKSAQQSFAEIETNISLVAASEMDLYFNADFEIQPFTVIKIYSPFPMFVKVITPPEGTGISSTYYGLIHGIGEEEKKELRRYINSIFFRELQENKAKEKEEVEALKQSFIDKKKAEEEERLRLEKEEKEKEEQEKAEEEERLRQEKEQAQEEIISEDGPKE